MMVAGEGLCGPEWHCRQSESYVQIKALEDDVLVRARERVSLSGEAGPGLGSGTGCQIA